MSRTKRYEVDRKARNKLANALQEVPDEYLLCRDLLHAWDIVKDFSVTDTGSIERTLLCQRCETIRFDSFSWDGEGIQKDRSKYSYPRDYQLKDVPRGVKPGAMIRKELFSRGDHTTTDVRRMRRAKVG